MTDTELREMEKELRNKIANEVSANLKAALENCACLHRDALNPGPGDMKTTYVERMQTMILNQIKNMK